MNKIILLTEKDLKDSISLTNYLKEASDNAHFALDKLCVMSTHIREIQRGNVTEYDPDNMDMVQHLRDEAYRLIGEVEYTCNTILRKMKELKE